MGRGKKDQEDKNLGCGTEIKQKKYYINVLATNSLIMSLITGGWYRTEQSTAATATEGGLKGGIKVSVELLDLLEDKMDSDMSTAARVGLSAATVPLALLVAPVTVPVGIGYALYEAKDDLDLQDLSPVSEDES